VVIGNLDVPAGFTAAALAERFALELIGDGGLVVSGVATLAHATAGQLSFLSNPRYRGQLADSQAGVVVMRAADAEDYAGTALLAADPYVAFARIAALFDPPPPLEPGIHASAVVHASASVDPGAQVDAFCSIGARSRIAAGAVIGPGCVIGDDCVVGEGSRLVARVTLVRRVRLGKRVLIHPGAVLGADGFGLAMDAGHWIKVPQQGGVLVVRLDNQIQIGHNVRIGAHTAMAGCAAVAGSATIGSYCLVGGAAGILGHLEVCDRVMITAMSLVTSSIREPGEYSSGTPLMPNREWRRNAARFRQLDTLARRVNAQDKPARDKED